MSESKSVLRKRIGHRVASTRTAARSVVETLEGRMMLSAAGHTLGAADNVGVLSSSPAQAQGAVGFASNTDDFYKFAVTSPSQVNVGVSGLDGNIALEMEDGSASQLSFSSFSTLSGSLPGSTSNVKYLDPGTYYVDVQGYSSALTTYAINLSAVAAPETGHTFSTAANLGNIGGVPQTIGGTLSTTTSDDYWRFSTGSGNFNAVVSGMKPNQGLVQVLNSSGQPVGPTIDPNNPPDPNVLAWPTSGLSGGTYYLHLESTAAATTPFSMAVSAGAGQVNKAGGEDPSHARNLGNLGATQIYQSNIKLTAPADWYKFTVTTPETVTVTLSGLAGNATVGIEDANSNTLAQSTYAGAAPQTISVALNPGTYYSDVALGGSVYTNLTLSLSAAPGGPVTPLDYAGNSPSAARNIGAVTTATQTFNDWIGAADTNDYYRFSVGANSTVHLTVAGNANLALYDSSGSNALAWANSDGQSATINTQVSAAGTYYARAYYANADSYYSIALSAQAAPVTPPDYAGNSPSAARDIGAVGSSAVSFNDWIGAADTNDYYRFTVGANATINLAVTGNANIALYDSSGTTLLASGNSNGQSASLSKSVAAAGVYYARVYPANADSYYTISLSAPVAPVTPVTPPDNAGNTPRAARSIGSVNTAAQTYNDWIGAADTNDYYSFTVGANSTINLAVTGNANIALYDVSGTNLLASAASTGHASALSAQVTAAGTYYARVYYANADSYYSIALSDTPVVRVVTDDGDATLAAARAIPNPITGGDFQYTDGYVGANDANDYFRFNVTSTAKMCLWATRYNSTGVQISLLDHNGNVMDTVTSAQNSPPVLLDGLLPGVYYMHVTPLNAGPGTTYRAWFLAKPYADIAGNTPQAAKVISAPLNGSTVQLQDFVGQIDPSDYYQFNLSARADVRLSLEGSANISLLNSNGTTVISSAMSNWQQPGSLTASNLPAGTYYALISYTHVQDSNYLLTMSANGSAPVVIPPVVTPPVVTPPVVTPPVITPPGGAMASATDIGAITGSLKVFNNAVSTAQTAAYYKFSFARPEELDLLVNGLTPNAPVNFDLLDSNGRAITSGLRTSAKSLWLSKDLLAGTYYVKVYTTGGGSNFRLAII
ncbi:MAG TPA: PPC domain-containing protein [Tepidisphaeraceae bacterium]|nr:PPC domain-containing protein [Tepidisphaeraceae bacterium]